MAARIRPTADEPRTRLKQVSLWSPTRLAILDAVHATPGLSVSDVARRIERHQATVWSHLHLLQQAGLVTSERAGRCLRLFPAGGVSAEERFRARLGASAFVYDAIASGAPGRAVPIANACGITRHAARRHLERLARIGALRESERSVLIKRKCFVPV